jgi:hypothetical protein
MEAMTKHRSHSAAFKRQVAEEFIAGETLHALSKRHDISRQLIRIWVDKYYAWRYLKNGRLEADSDDDPIYNDITNSKILGRIQVSERTPPGWPDSLWWWDGSSETQADGC